MLDLPVPLRPISATRSAVSRAKSAPSSNATWPNARWALVRVRRAMRESERVATFDDGPLSRAGDAGFQRVDEHLGDVEAGLVGDLLEAGRAGDVDLGERVADDVQAHQQQATAGQL